MKNYPLYFVLIITLFLLSLFKVISYASDGYTYISKFGGQSSERLYNVSAVAVDTADNIYIAENYGNIQVFNKTGNFVNSWQAYSDDVRIIGLFIDSNSNIYTLPSNVLSPLSKIKKFDLSGNLLNTYDNLTFTNANAIAVDSLGNIYLSYSTNDNQIKKYDQNGNLLLQWGNSGSGDGQLMYPAGLDIDSNGNVYVVDAGNNRIQKFGEQVSSGVYIAHISGAGIKQTNKIAIIK